MSRGDVAALLGVSRQRVHQLEQSDPEFPEPIGKLATVVVYRRADVERYRAERVTKSEQASPTQTTGERP